MLCLTGNEQSVDDLADRLERPDEGATGQLHEVRLDLLRERGEALIALLARHRKKLICCCRPRRERGGWRGSEDDRLRLLARVAELEPAFVDVEHDVSDASLRYLRRKRARCIISYHGGSDRLDKTFGKVLSRGPDVAKVAVDVHDPADLCQLLETARGCAVPTIAVGVGSAGLLSRVRYKRFGSPWTYVAECADLRTALGQLTLSEAERLNLPGSVEHPFLALVGGPGVVHSPGQRVYNQLFRRYSHEWSYVAVPTERPVEVFDLLKELGAVGVSVTAPYKRVALEYAQTADSSARKVGAANSLRLDADACTAANTDVDGIVEPLRRRVDGERRRRLQTALILGAGGAARAAIAACKKLKLRATVAARSSEEDLDLSGAQYVPWTLRHSVEADVLINATPLGGTQDPWGDVPLASQVVFDLTLENPSKLLARARRSGCQTIHGHEMWAEQGARQMTWISGAPVSPTVLWRLLEEAPAWK